MDRTSGGRGASGHRERAPPCANLAFQPAPHGEAATCAAPMWEFQLRQVAEKRLCWEEREPCGKPPDDHCREVPVHRFDPLRAVCEAAPARLPAALPRVFAEQTILAVRFADGPVAPACARR